MPKFAVTNRYIRLGGVAFQEQAVPRQRVVPPTPLAEWDFSQASAPFLSTAGDLPLSQGHATSFVTRTTSPWGYAASFASGGRYLKLDAASVGRLNIGAAGVNRVSVAAWVYVTDTDMGFIGGCWQENDGDPRRQYGLFYDLNLYGGNERVNMHVSKTGGASPGLPYSRDYAASNETFTRNTWVFMVGTYDGTYAVAYTNGQGTAYRNYTEPGPPNGQSLTYDKNPYLFTLGLNDTPCDFTVGAVQLTSGMGNFMNGQIAKLRVWDQTLTPQDIQTLYNAEVALIP